MALCACGAPLCSRVACVFQVGSGINPETTELLDDPKERMDAARDALVAMRAIDASTMTLTHLGKALDRLPVDLPMGKAIVEAAGDALQCSVAVATIAAVSRVVGDGLSLFDGDRSRQVGACSTGLHWGHTIGCLAGCGCGVSAPPCRARRLQGSGYHLATTSRTSICT
jgi:hypothetical protein